MTMLKRRYENSVERREDDPCWRYCLKEVESRNFLWVEYEKNAKTFFLRIAKTVEKIDGLTDCDS